MGISRKRATAFVTAAAGTAAASGLALVAVTSPAAASSTANNKGDVWVDNVGQPPGPGHEMDPHLACADINLWADKLASSHGSYTIDGWAPSGSKEQVYAGSWSYDRTQGGDQVTSVINVQQLVATATADGDAPVNSQGLHFKLQFVQNPHKHKTFWVDCGTTTPSTPPYSPPPGY